MDSSHTNQNRTERLRKLVEQDGGPAEFARIRSMHDADKPIDASYISQILNGHRAFGEKAAFNMAKRAGLPPDYFDKYTEESQTEEPTTQADLPRRSAKLQRIINKLDRIESSGTSSPQLIHAIEAIIDLAVLQDKTKQNPAISTGFTMETRDFPTLQREAERYD